MNLLWIGIATGSIGALVVRALVNEFVSLMRDISTLRETLFAIDDFKLEEFKDPVEDFKDPIEGDYDGLSSETKQSLALGLSQAREGKTTPLRLVDLSKGGDE